MQENNDHIEALLPRYFEESLSEEQKLLVDEWKSSSEDNQQIFVEAKYVWEAINQLNEMQKFDTKNALNKVHKNIHLPTKANRFFSYWQKVAAILLIPFIIATAYFLTKENPAVHPEAQTVTIKAQPGILSEFLLPDGTKVWLNAGSELVYPAFFESDSRNVSLTGEAFFDVIHDQDKPFMVNAGNINIKVLGTSFNVINYSDEVETQVVLASGKVKLFSGEANDRKALGILHPGEKALYHEKSQKMSIEKVNVEKYIGWKDGKLIFRDDPLKEVIKKLNRRFNVDIQLADKTLEAYVYTATFEDETLYQILDLLKISAPIDYKVIPSDRNEKQKNKPVIILEVRK